MCNGPQRYRIHNIPGEMPKWLSYSGEGCSLSFHIPPVFQGLVLWAVHPLEKDARYYYSTDIIIIIRNKSNGIQLFKGHGSPGTAGESEVEVKWQWKITMEMTNWNYTFIQSQQSFTDLHITNCTSLKNVGSM